ncbi:MAG: ureidoglycolate lyase [Acidobacteria bacterium]|nr:ureidoglycolate lyase [Acidobacteriota bacterium]
MRVPLRAPDAGLFAPFGAFIDAPERVGVRRMYSDWLAAVPGLAPQFHTNRVAASSLPLTIDRVERHPHAPQVFLPLDVSRYVVTVMAADAAGAPDPVSALAFLLPPTLGVVYRAGVWHAGMTALDREASFGVMMWRGASDDDVFAAIPPVHVVAPAAAGAAGGAHG